MNGWRSTFAPRSSTFDCYHATVARGLVVGVIGVVLALGGALVLAGRAPGPTIEVHEPTRLIGQSAQLDLAVEAPGGDISRVDVAIEQDGAVLPLFSLDSPVDAVVRQEMPERIRVSRRIDRASVPALQPGAVTLVVTAVRPVLFGLRERATTVRRDLEVRFEPPRLAVLSTFHHINHGGTEMVVYGVTPPDVVESGVRVGRMTYPGHPAAAAGVTGADDTVRVAFFALLFDQELTTPLELYAIDEAGNEGQAEFDHQIFPQPFRRTQIQLTDTFLERVVPRILERSPAFREETIADEDLLGQYLKINREMRRRNAETIALLGAETEPRILWQGPFRQLSNSRVESGFAEHRTYLYQGQEVDYQVHLGFDLAATVNVPILAANGGRVVYADYLGIYGNCVIIDHGLGLRSLYAHLSSLEVARGDLVDRDERIGRSGATGLAGGDHLHFTMLLYGRPVTPVEWWDPHWIEDRIARKLRAASSALAPNP